MTKFNLSDGERIQLKTDVGTIEITVTTDDTVMTGTIIAPHGLPDVNINKLISSDEQYVEPISGMHQMVGHRVEIIKSH